MTTMKAVRIRSFGGPDVLELADVEKPAKAQVQLEQHHAQGKVVLQMGA